ncbi:holo-ACP synthase [Idiomarina tyrosinivorans]|uniref:Holo-[acyl-carrier-protein] synthase n=1 Tax=Idiomarina tyrosinivorans TaxID=1445662 RepID=A0A432ZRT1_9GAMM|nr:holo-ACP synthase [Idiomarina tyrosinivorans]RUO80599.1 holo-ACP synthase [Idiomarina tyrosinivorans]
MAIFGIGTDLVQIARIAKVLERGDQLARRVLTEHEWQQWQTTRDVHFLAKRWAAKEACAKAFGTGIGQGLSFQHMQVEHDDLGRPHWQFSGVAQQWCEQHSIVASHLSISDEQDYALAYVILETAVG